jgi:hypothetical protein
MFAHTLLRPLGQIITALGIAVGVTVCAVPAAVQQDTRTNGTNLFVDGGLTTTAVNFAVGSVGSQLLEIRASVRFMKADGEAYGVNNGGTPFYNEIDLRVVSPSGTTENLIAPGDFLAGAGGFGFGQIQFRPGSGYPITNVDPTTPQAGNYRPTGNLRNLENEVVAGNWTLILGDTVPQDGLSVDRWRVRIWSGDPQSTVASSTSFGNVLVGTNSDLTNSVSNTGDSRAITNDGTVVSTLLSGTFDNPVGGDFSLVGSNAFSDVEVGGPTADRDYRFSPATRGFQSTTAQITTDGGNTSLSLTGQGVAPQALIDTTSANAGQVRIGDTGTAGLVLTNVGDGNLSGLGVVSNLNGDFVAATGLFSSAGQVFSLTDASLAFENYTYAPTTRGGDSQDVTLDLSNGSPDGTNSPLMQMVTLLGQGVGAEFTSVGDVAGVFNYGNVTLGDTVSLMLDLSNLTPDGDLGALTDLSLLGSLIAGGDAGDFSLLGFSPTVLSDGESIGLNIEFTPTAAGLRSSTLSFLTDQNAPLGLGGLSFNFSLSGSGVAASMVPEPSTGALFLSALLFWLACDASRRRRRNR